MLDFTDEERRIFPYSWGGQEMYADPLEVHLRIVSALGADPNVTLREARVEDNEAVAAQARLRIIDAVRQALDLPAVDRLDSQAPRATARECERILDEYIKFSTDAKKKPASTPTCSPATRDWEDSPDPAAL